jgi:hypothetical protein
LKNKISPQCVPSKETRDPHCMNSGRTVAQDCTRFLIANLTALPGRSVPTLAYVRLGRVRTETIVETGAEPTGANVSLAEHSAVSHIAATVPPTVVTPPASVTPAVLTVVRVFRRVPSCLQLRQRILLSLLLSLWRVFSVTATDGDQHQQPEHDCASLHNDDRSNDF